MADLKESCISLLATTGAIDFEDERTVALYTVPTGKRMIIDQVAVHSNSDDLAGMNDVDFGKGAVTPASALVWVETHDLTDMSAANDQKIIRADDAEYGLVDGDDATVANRTFNMVITAGATADPCTGIVDLFGYLIDS